MLDLTHVCFYTLANSVQYVCLKGGFLGTPGTPSGSATDLRGFISALFKFFLQLHPYMQRFFFTEKPFPLVKVLSKLCIIKMHN